MGLPQFKKNQKVCLKMFGRDYNVRYIDEGSFAQCFLDGEDGETVYLLVPESEFGDDMTKEILCNVYAKNKGNPYLPEIERMGADHIFDGVFCKVFKMPFYKDISPKDKAWIEMKRLHKLRDDAMYEAKDKHEEKTGEDGSLTFLGNKMNKLIVKKAEEKKMDDDLVDALDDITMEIDKYKNDGIAMEFNKDNTGIDKNGHLIFRDIIYDSGMVVKIKEAHKNKND